MKKIYILFVTLLSLAMVKGQGQTTIFSDDFETDKGWGIYEELVGGNPCYDDSIGEVARSDDYAAGGIYSLRVWANKFLSNKSNHVLGNIQINTTGLLGEYSLSTCFFIPPAPDTAQTGPEFSLQSTRNVSGTNLTFTAGIQYIQNPWVNQKWWIWNNATWTPLNDTIFNFHLEKNHWYTMELNINYDSNTYRCFSLKDITNLTIDTTICLSKYGFTISGENKGFSPATWITLESENLWTNCNRPTQARMYYDNVYLVKNDTCPFIQSNHETSFIFYPNPVKNNLIIETSFKGSILSISDINGEEMMKQQLKESKTQIDLSRLHNGVYFVKVINNKTSVVKKIIKE